MSESRKKLDARHNILSSIRAHLAASVAREQRLPTHDSTSTAVMAIGSAAESSNLELFRHNLEAVDGHCVIAQTESELVDALSSIIADLSSKGTKSSRVAVSDAAELERMVRVAVRDVGDVKVVPSTQEIFDFDIGVTTAQAAIAETGTLVLDGSAERHRLISLVPPIHIAIVEASNICTTLGEALVFLRRGTEGVSPAVTFITGPSRTGDIELTLTIGVHGPQKLYVIVMNGKSLTVE